VRRLHDAGLSPLGEPRWDDDHFGEKIELLCARPPEAVSFTFGCPGDDVIRRLHAAGSEVWLTVTHPDEVEGDVDALVVQGAEAGGHRGGAHAIPLKDLLAISDLPVIATGGLMTREHVEEVLNAGAVAAACGTAFLLAPEAGTSQAQRDAVASDRPTALTRAFTGRTARGIVNGFMTDHGEHAPDAYPEIHHVTAPLRKQAREQGNGELINLWAGTNHHLAVARPAADTVRALTP
jgi:nitronate monooxygenase